MGARATHRSCAHELPPVLSRVVEAVRRGLWLCLALPVLLGAAAAPSVYTPGILASKSSGVYAALNSEACCWLARRATLRVPVPAADVDTLLMTVEIPPYALAAEPAAFRVRVGRAKPVQLCCFGPGQHELAIHLSPGASPQKHTLSVRVRPNTFFIPAARGINNDTRELTVLLQRVTLLDSATGTQYLAGRAIEANGISRNEAIARTLLIAVVFLASIVLVRLRVASGWLLLLASAPFSFSVAAHGTTITLAKAVFVACALAAIPLLRQMRARGAFAVTAASAAFLAFVVASALSALGAAVHHDAIREALKIAEYFAIFVLAGAYYAIAPDERMLRIVLAASVTVVAALAILQLHGGVKEYETLFGHTFARIAGPLGGPNQLGAYLAIGITALAALRPPGERMLPIAATAFAAIALLLTFSRGGVLQLVAGLACVAALRSAPTRARAVAWIAGAAVALACAVVLAVALDPGFAPFQRIFGDPSNFNGGLGTRTGLWPAALQLWAQHPILGIGPGNFEDAIGRFLPGVRTHPNSYFLELLAEGGTLGLLAFTWLAAALMRTFAAAAAQPIAVAAFAVLVGMLLHLTYDGVLIYPKVGVFFWVLLAYAFAAIREARAKSASC